MEVLSSALSTTEAFVTELFERKKWTCRQLQRVALENLGPPRYSSKNWVRQMCSETVSIAKVCILCPAIQREGKKIPSQIHWLRMLVSWRMEPGAWSGYVQDSAYKG